MCVVLKVDTTDQDGLVSGGWSHMAVLSKMSEEDQVILCDVLEVHGAAKS